MGKRLYVGNLSFNVTNESLEELFSQFGPVQSAQVVMDRDSGRSKGFGFVEMGDDNAAQQAIRGLNDKEHDGRPLSVNEARRAKSAVADAADTAAAVVVVDAAATVVVSHKRLRFVKNRSLSEKLVGDRLLRHRGMTVPFYYVVEFRKGYSACSAISTMPPSP